MTCWAGGVIEGVDATQAEGRGRTEIFHLREDGENVRSSLWLWQAEEENQLVLQHQSGNMSFTIACESKAEQTEENLLPPQT